MKVIQEVTPAQAKKLVALQLAQPAATRLPLGFIGHRGDGKTQVVAQAAKEAGYNYYPLYTAQNDAVDFTGNPHYDAKTNATIYGRPVIFPAENEKAVLVLEELNRAPSEVRQACMQLLTDRKIGTHKLPEDTLICVCINPPNDIYDVAELDSAMTNRISWMNFKTDVDEFMAYAYNVGMHENVIKMIGTNREMLSQPAVEVSPSPRTWEMVSNVLKGMPEGTEPELVDAMISGLVGSIAATSYRRLANNGFRTPVTGREVLADYKAVKAKVEEQKNKNSDMWYTVKDLVALIESESKTKPKIQNLVSFVRDLKPEWQQYIITKTPQPVLTKMCQEDKEFALFISEIKAEIMKLK